MPIFFVPSLVFSLAAMNSISPRNGTGTNISREICPRHALPERPVVDAVLAPDIEAMRNILALHDSVHAPIFTEADIPFARREKIAVALAIVVEIPAVMGVGQIIDRVVEVAVVVVISIEKLLDIERAAHTDALVKYVGMAQREIECVISAEAAACGDDSGRWIALPDQR